MTGIGLMVGIELENGLRAADVLDAAGERGLLVLTAKDRLRLLPPLTLTEYDVERALKYVGDALSACGAALSDGEDPV